MTSVKGAPATMNSGRDGSVRDSVCVGDPRGYIKIKVEASDTGIHYRFAAERKGIFTAAAQRLALKRQVQSSFTGRRELFFRIAGLGR
jgi:hypothetical protein